MRAKNLEDVLRIAERMYGVEGADAILRASYKVPVYKGFDEPLPDSIGYTQHSSECTNDTIQEILLFADGIREYTQPIVYGLTPEQINIRSNLALHFSDWNRYSDYFQYIQKRFRSHYDVLNFMKKKGIKAQKYVSDYTTVCGLDPIFYRKTRDSLEAGILALKKLKGESMYTETGFPIAKIASTINTILQWLELPYTIHRRDTEFAVGIVVTSLVGKRKKNEDGIHWKQLSHTSGFIKMVGKWYYYDNEIGFYQVDNSVVQAAMDGTLAIIRYGKLYFAKWIHDDVTEVWENGTWSKTLAKAIKDTDDKISYKATLLIVDTTHNVCIVPSSEIKYHNLCKPFPSFPVSTIAEVNTIMGKFKECILANPLSNSRIFGDMYHFLYDHVHLLREDSALLLMVHQSIRSVIQRPACRPLIHYWSYKIGRVLENMQDGSLNWFEIPKLKSFVVRSPKDAPTPKKESLKTKTRKNTKKCPEGQVLDKVTKECRERKKPGRQTKKNASLT